MTTVVGLLSVCLALCASCGGSRAIPSDPTAAAAMFRERCEKDRFVHCYNLGLLYSRGRGVKKDMSSAALLWAKACKGGVEQSCGRIGGAYLYGRGVKHDPAKAIALLK